MKKAMWLLTAAVMLWMLAGCGAASESPVPAASEPDAWGSAVSETAPEAQVLETAPVLEVEDPLDQAPAPPSVAPAPPMDTEPAEPAPQEAPTMTITIGGRAFPVTLEESETTTALLSHLPLTLDMSELHGNEKYNYLDFSLPTDSYAPGHIEIGDVMLYGDDCLVVFYESFSTAYGYTRVGWIADTAGLKDAVGSGNVQMTFTGSE